MGKFIQLVRIPVHKAQEEEKARDKYRDRGRVTTVSYFKKNIVYSSNGNETL